MLHKILNIIFQLFLVVLLLITLITSLKAIYLNLKYFDVIKTGTITDIEYRRGDTSKSGRGIYLNTIITDNEIETVYGGSQNQYEEGDKVKLRYRGIGGNVIFEVKGVRMRSKYDTWDFLSPIMLIFASFMLFKIITVWFLPSIKKCN